jgi:hypothetical protein
MLSKVILAEFYNDEKDITFFNAIIEQFSNGYQPFFVRLIETIFKDGGA